MDLRRELKQAITDGQVVPHFQPIVDLRTGEITGFELLARWTHPVRGMIPPIEFIPIAEDERLIPLLTEALLRHALTSWQELPSDASLSLNISPTQLCGDGLAMMIKTVAGEVSFPLERLTLEITESALLENYAEAKAAIATLKEIGCRLALDDFGTGYSSLTYLRTLPLDILKIDQSFVRTMVSRREDRKIVGAVVGLGKSLGLKIVAEGIEERAQAEMLLCLGCECGQGWLYGRPAPAEEAHRVQACKPVKRATVSTERNHSILCMEALPGQSYAQLTAIYNSAPVGLCFLDCSFRFINLNHRLAAFHGLAIEELLGRTIREIDPGTYGRVEPYLLRARLGETIENVEFFRPATQLHAEVAHLVSFQPALDEVGEVVGILISITDITERKRIETALKQSHDQYCSMVELSPQFPWTMDADGTNLETSPKWNELTGVPLEQARDRVWGNVVHPDDRREMYQSVRACILEGEAFDVEFRVKDRHGVWRWIRSRGTPRRDHSGTVLRWYGSFDLIDEHRKALSALRESHTYLQSVLDALPVGVVIAEAPTGRIVSRNPCAQQILAQDPVHFEFISDYSKRVAYYRGGVRLSSEDFPLAKALQRGETSPVERVFYDLGKGKGKWVDLSGAPLRNGAGEIVGAVAALQEVSSGKRTVVFSFLNLIGSFLERRAAFWTHLGYPNVNRWQRRPV